MSKYKFLIVLLFLVGLSVNAHPGDHSEKKDIKRLKSLFFMAENDLYDGRLLLKVKDKIELTKEQEEKILELRFASYLKSENGEMNRKQVAAYIREISNKKTDLIVQYMNHLLDLKEILTPEQVQKMAEIREKMKTLKRKEFRERFRKN